MSNVERPVVEAIETALIAVEHTNLFAGLERPQSKHVPAQSIFVFQSGGFKPEHYMGCGGSHREVFVEVRVRDEGSKRARCLTTALAIFDLLDQVEYLPGVGGFISMDALESTPIYLGRNTAKEHIYYTQFVVGYTYTKA